MAGVRVERLAAVIGAPSTEPDDVDWSLAHRILGVTLPSDYRRMVEAYGGVHIGGRLMVAAIRSVAAIDNLRKRHGLLRSIRAADPAAHPYAFFPEPGGLLLWGQTSDTDMLLWDTTASFDPDQWPTMALLRAEAERWQRIDAPMTEIIMQLVTGQLVFPASDRTPPYTNTHRRMGRAAPTPARAEEPPVPVRRPAVDPVFAASLTATAAPVPVAEAATVGLPADYRGLMATLGPGTLAGVLRLVGPGAPEGFDRAALEAHHHGWLAARRVAGLPTVPVPVAPAAIRPQLWGVFDTGETCWWQPTTSDPDRWPVLVLDADGLGWQRLPYAMGQFLDRWLDGQLDLPVLSMPPARRPRRYTPAGAPVAAVDVQPQPRDPVAPLATLIGPPDGEHHHYDWAALADRLGVAALPADFRRLVQTRGVAVINGFYLVDPDEHVDMQREFGAYLADEPGSVPHPAPGGWLICATIESGEALWWDTTRPDPDAWTMVWWSGGQQYRFAGTCTELIVHDLTGRLVPPLTGKHPCRDEPWIE